MIYLHEELLGNNLIRHWANEIDDATDPLYRVPTYKVHKIDTNEYYDDAFDLINEKRIEVGLKPYYYEETNIVVENKEEHDDVPQDNIEE